MKEKTSMPLFWLYKRTMTLGKPLILGLLNQRMKKGKEDPERIKERFGTSSIPRPAGPLMWVHVASVGEAQSVLHLISLFLAQNKDASVLVTSITRTSAELLSKRLPERAIHQFLPVDRPKWVRRFIDHWKPDLIIWAESELWPTILSEIEHRNIPTALINARMSPKSFANWSKAKSLARKILGSFTVILTQTGKDADYYTKLGGRSVVAVGNIKFASAPLPSNEADLANLKTSIGDRPLWVYASTHAGEEDLAAETHLALKQKFPDLLTIIVPRHPERRVQILDALQKYNVTICMRGENKTQPTIDTDIYVADTLGELGLFYRLSPLSCIGRSFSLDGGGGHNPLEAAQLKSAVIHGPAIQNLKDIFDPMDAEGASLCVKTPSDLAPTIANLLGNKESLNQLAQKGYTYARGQDQVLDTVIKELEPLFLLTDLPVLKATKSTD